MAKKVILKDDNVEIMPITRGELVLDSSGQLAFHSSQFLATQSLPGLMSGEDKTKLDSLEKVIAEDKKVEQVNTTTNSSYRILFSNSADDATKTEGARKSTKLLFNPYTGSLTATTLIGKLDWSNLNEVPENFTPTQHIHNTSEITALFNYNKANSESDLVATDTLNTALGKLEYKADTAYQWVMSVTTTDTDEYINKWQEILDFLNTIDNTEGADITDEFVTRKTLQTITGSKIFSGTEASILTIDRDSTNPTWIRFKQSGNLLGYLGINGDKKPLVNIDNNVCDILHSGNSYIKDGVITINNASIAPMSMANCYWANLPVSSTPDAATKPIFAEATVKAYSGNSLIHTYPVGTANYTGLVGHMSTSDSSLVSHGLIFNASSCTSFGGNNSLTLFNNRGYNFYSASHHYFDNNVGIGTNLPAYKLDIAGSARANVYYFLDNSNTASAGYIGRATDSNNSIYLYAPNDNIYMTVRDGVAMTILPTGNTIINSSSYNLLSLVRNTTNVEAGIGIQFANNNGTVAYLHALPKDGYFYRGISTNNYMILDTGNYASHTVESRAWTAVTTKNAWSRIMTIGSNSNVILTICFSQNSLASAHGYFISTGWNCARIMLVMMGGFTGNSTPQVRITSTNSTTFHVEVYNTYGYNGATSISFGCRAILAYGSMSTISTYTAGGGTVASSLTSSATVAMNFNADMVDGYHVNGNQKPYGKIPLIGADGVMEVGKYLDFHNDNTTGSDYSTRLLCGGNHSNVVTLPSATGTLALTSQIPTSLPANGGNADTVDNKHASDFATAGHTHGTYHTNFTTTLADTTTDSGWSMINSSYSSGFLLKSIRTQAVAPGWIEGNYAAGICFGGADTKGVISCAYGSPAIRIAGGNGSKPVWWIRIVGTNNAGYNLDSMPYAVSAGTANAVAWGNITGKPSTFTPSSHTHSYITDAGNGTAIYAQYSSGGWTSNPDWLCAWSGFKITYVSPSNVSVGYASSAGSVAWANVTGKPTIPSVGNGTVTIKQAGTSKGSFTMNQSGNTTIELTDNNTWRPIHWAIYQIFFGSTNTFGCYKKAGNFDFYVNTHTLEKSGSVIINVTYPSGFSETSTMIWGNGDHKENTLSNPVYLTVNKDHSYLRLMLADDSSVNWGYAYLYFMCIG